MFFCSKEHQKLVSTLSLSLSRRTQLTGLLQVWSVHKRVCGKKSNPFRWPALSDTEVAEYLELSQIPLDAPGDPLSTWEDKLGDERGIPTIPGIREKAFKVYFATLSANT